MMICNNKKWNVSQLSQCVMQRRNTQLYQNDFHFGSSLFFTITLIFKRLTRSPCRFYCDQVVTAERWMLFELEWRCGVTIPASNSERLEMKGVSPTFKTEGGEWHAQGDLSINKWTPVTISYSLLRMCRSQHFHLAKGIDKPWTLIISIGNHITSSAICMSSRLISKTKYS